MERTVSKIRVAQISAADIKEVGKDGTKVGFLGKALVQPPNICTPVTHPLFGSIDGTQLSR
jgi:hypothetical protein